jgi:hypothetical protein
MDRGRAVGVMFFHLRFGIHRDEKNAKVFSFDKQL